MNNLIEIKPKTMQIILILLTFIFSHGVKSDQLKTNCGIKFNNLVCMNLDLNNNINLNLLDEPYRIIIDFEKGRIIVVNSRDRHYNWKKIVLEKLKQQ